VKQSKEGEREKCKKPIRTIGLFHPIKRVIGQKMRGAESKS